MGVQNYLNEDHNGSQNFVHGFQINGTDVTATAAELNHCAGTGAVILSLASAAANIADPAATAEGCAAAIASILDVLIACGAVAKAS